MTRKIALLAAVALLVLGCSRSGKMQRGQQQYDVVKEGSANGVTSTINGPGETPARATDTSADTATNFTLPTNPNPLGNDTAGATVAGTFPPASSSVQRVPHSARSFTDTRGMASSSPPVASDTASAPTATTDTSLTTTSTDTETTTASSSSGSMKKKGDRSKSGDDQPPPPPPPADTTDTRG